jgi:hypothetical protein
MSLDRRDLELWSHLSSGGLDAAAVLAYAVAMGTERPQCGDWRFRELYKEADRKGLKGDARKRYVFGAARKLGWTHPGWLPGGDPRQKSFLGRILGL